MRDHIGGYSFSWTQPYSVSMNPFYQHNELTVQEELERLEEIDDRVSLMDSYPDAEKLLKMINKR
jgi:predicted CoA-binding protein